MPFMIMKVSGMDNGIGYKELSKNVDAEYEEVTSVKNLIYLVRNQQVMMDSDLAMLYQVKTGRLNEAVRRNISRFPERFRFQLTKDECENLISQIAISSSNRFTDLKSQIATSGLGNAPDSHGGRRKLPYVFTEQGIAMLSSILRSDIAISVSIRIMDSFVETRKYMANASLLHERLNTMEIRQINYQKEADERFDRVFDYIAAHEDSAQRVFFDGQIYDAFSLIARLIEKADSSLILDRKSVV